ncbi:hypothetical protein Areg01_81290 [Actinoplanes regularis]|nr:hypothetical protein Areg01_81290 [Actinoplanes regularis]
MVRGIEHGAQIEIPGVIPLHLVINDDKFVTAAIGACLLLLRTCRLLKQRHLETNRSRPSGQLLRCVDQTFAECRQPAVPAACELPKIILNAGSRVHRTAHRYDC